MTDPVTPDYIPRDLGPLVARAMRQMPVVVVVGPRQTGKSTFLLSDPAFAGMPRAYRTLDDFAHREAALAAPEDFVETSETLAIDEAQRAPELLIAIKRSIDRDRRPGRFLLTGSADFRLLSAVGESLAGRAVTFVMHPLSRRELARAAARPSWLAETFEAREPPRRAGAKTVKGDEVLRGGFPPVVLARPDADPWLWFRGYEQTYLERDVRDLLRVADLVGFRTLLKLAALRTGQVLNTSEIARDAKLNVSTAGRYLHTLEASFILGRLEPFLRNRASRLIKSPKLYVADSGLAAYLTGVDDLAPGADEPLRGALFETYVAQNVGAIVETLGPRASLGFWHVQGRHEVDFVVSRGRDIVALEIKSASRWRDADLASLRVFLGTTPACIAGVLAHTGTETVKLGERLWAAPLDAVLS